MHLTANMASRAVPKRSKTPEISAEGKKKLSAASMSLYVNIALIVLKAVVAIITGSLAILAELLHSFFDMCASILAYVGIKKADQPDDSDHQYGHEKYENISSLAQTVLIVLTSAFVIYEAVHRIIKPTPIEAGWIGLVVMGVTIVADYFVSKYLHKASSDYESSALEADAYHFTTDLWGAIAVIIGLIFVLLGFPVFDSIAAIVVAILMLWIAYKLGTKSLNVLLDKCPSDSVMRKIGRIIKKTAYVKSYHKLKVRQAGNKLLVNVCIVVNSQLSVRKGHDIAHRLEKNLKEKLPNIKHAIIHVEPED